MKNKLLLVVALVLTVILIIEIIGIGVYTVFVKKDNNQVSDNNQNNSSVDNNKDDENQNINNSKIHRDDFVFVDIINNENQIVYNVELVNDLELEEEIDE